LIVQKKQKQAGEFGIQIPLKQRHSQTKSSKASFIQKTNSQDRTEKASQIKPDGCIYRDTIREQIEDKYAFFGLIRQEKIEAGFAK